MEIAFAAWEAALLLQTACRYVTGITMSRAQLLPKYKQAPGCAPGRHRGRHVGKACCSEALQHCRAQVGGVIGGNQGAQLLADARQASGNQVACRQAGPPQQQRLQHRHAARADLGAPCSQGGGADAGEAEQGKDRHNFL